MDYTYRSNNDIMWDCFVDIMNEAPTEKTEETVTSFMNSYYKYKGKEVEYNFSHDNWTLVYCWVHRFYPERKKELPVFGHHSLHPIRFLKFLWMKYQFLFFLFLPVFAEMIIMAHFLRKTPKGNYHTSGLLLDYYVLHSFNLDGPLEILTEMATKKFSGGWEEIFRIYHDKPERYNYKVYTTFLEKQ